MKRGRTEPIKGLEYDALTGWRHKLCVFDNNTGLSRWWKRHYAKRVRRKVKRELSETT
jgi:hypothetical protein